MKPTLKKKQGMLGITFANEKDYDLIQEDDTFNFVDIADFAPDKQLYYRSDSQGWKQG